MIPNTGDDLRQDFVFANLPSRTLKLDFDWLTINGTIDQIQAVELKDLIGKDPEYCIPEIERRIREALLQDDRITAVENFQFEVNKKQVLTTFTVISIFGELKAEKAVEI